MSFRAGLAGPFTAPATRATPPSMASNRKPFQPPAKSRKTNAPKSSSTVAMVEFGRKIAMGMTSFPREADSVILIFRFPLTTAEKS